MSELSAKEVVEVHVFTVFIFPSETMQIKVMRRDSQVRQCDEIISKLFLISSQFSKSLCYFVVYQTP